MADLDFKTGHLCGKYVVSRTDESPVLPEEAFFILRLDTDPHARTAAIAYAAARRSKEKTLELGEGFKVEKSDGTPMDPAADVLVLQIKSDRHSRTALRAYAVSVARENKPFAREILAWLWEFVESDHVQCGCREAMCPHTPFFSKEGLEQFKAERAIV